MCHRSKRDPMPMESSSGAKVIHLAGGCFWGLEKYLTGLAEDQGQD